MRQEFRLTPDDIARFFKFAPPITTKAGCWEWKGYCKPNGYGDFQLYRLRTEGYKRTGSVGAHVVMMAFCTGKHHELLADNRKRNQLVLRHLCGNKKCVYPGLGHVVFGTQKENIEDNERDGTLPYGEKVGSSKITEDIASEIYEIGKVLPRGPSGRIKRGALTPLVRRYGITKTMVSYIIHGHWWQRATEKPNFSATDRERIEDTAKLFLTQAEQAQPRGEKSKTAKLVTSQVQEIKAAYVAWPRSPNTGKPAYGVLTRLAEKYGVSVPTIEGIVSGRWWTHVKSVAEEELTVAGT